MLFTGASSVQADNILLEHQVKAAFLFNFAKFVKWPPEVFTDKKSPIVLGVLGGGSFGDILEEMVQGQALNGRPIRVKQSSNIEDLQTCQLLFISPSEQQPMRGILKQLQGKSILTVSESEGFILSGGVIQFVKKGNKLRFQINRQAAKEANLKISSKLLKLADRS